MYNVDSRYFIFSYLKFYVSLMRTLVCCYTERPSYMNPGQTHVIQRWPAYTVEPVYSGHL